MSNRNKNKLPSVSYNGFGGINMTSKSSTGATTKEIVNFSIMKDGSLKKRCGTRKLTDIEGTIRAIHTPIVNGKQELYILSNNNVYKINFENGFEIASNKLIATIPTQNNTAQFFTFNGNTYITDGSDIYEFDDETNTYSHVTGYVPLIGKDWQNNFVGDEYETRNILNKHARITYNIVEPVSIYLCTEDLAASVEAVYVNGAKLSDDSYSIGERFNTINVPNLSVGDRVEVYFSYGESKYSHLDKLISSECSAIFGGSDNNRIMLSGIKDSSTVFCSKPISQRMLDDSLKIYPESNELYFPEGYEINIGNGSGAVQSILRHHNNILIFTDSELWVASPEDDYSGKINAYSVNSEIGASTKNGVVLAGNDPISIGRHSVWLWKNESGTARKYAAIKLSDAIDDELNKIGLDNCGLFFCESRNEVWVYSRISNEIWIYNFDVSSWYKFKGISADRIFDFDGNIVFIKNNSLYLFDENAYTDMNETGKELPINAYYLTNENDFNLPKLKNLSAIELSADLCDENISIELEDVNGVFKHIDIRDNTRNTHSYLRKYVPSRRFASASIRIKTSAMSPQVIHSLKITTR